MAGPLLRPPGAARPERAAVLLLGAAALVYALSLDYFYVGRLTDDARHFLAAQSLLQGRFVDLSQPGEPPLVNQLPGYPLLLTPAAALGSLRLAQWTSVLFLLAACFLLLRLFRAQGPAGRWAVALTALSPLAVVSATTVMSEAALLFFSAWTCLRLDDALAGPAPRRRDLAALAGPAGFCVWIHPQGAALLLAAAWLLLNRRRRRGALFLGIAGTVALLPLLRNWIAAGTPAAYFQELSGGAAGMAAVFLGNLTRWPFLIAEALFHWVEPLPGAASGVARLFGLAAVLLIGIELAKGPTMVDRIARAYAVAFVGLHLFWPNQLHRYVLPLLPFLYLALLRPFFAPRPQAAALGRRLAGFLAALFLLFDLTLVVNAGRTRAGENRTPPAWDWLRWNTAPGSVLAAFRPEPLYLYTGHKALRLPRQGDPDAWFAALVDKDVRFCVADHAERDLVPTAGPRRSELEAGLRRVALRLEDPERFQRVYQDDEGGVVYELRGAYEFREGWRLLEAARGELALGRLEPALALLNRAERRRAPLVRLPFYRGTTLLLLGRRRQARPLLEEAVRREPGFAAARANLARTSDPRLALSKR